MNIIRKRGWELPESEATPEAVFFNRRSVIAGLAGAGALLAGGGFFAPGLCGGRPERLTLSCEPATRRSPSTGRSPPRR